MPSSNSIMPSSNSTTTAGARAGHRSVRMAINNPTVLTPLADLPKVPHNWYINVLAVLIGPREDARKLHKKDYYIQEPSSIVAAGRRRKTVLSIWRECDWTAFNRDVKPGDIFVVYGAAANKKYEEDVATKVLKLEKSDHGHLNIYKDHPGGWYVCNPVDIQGYHELVVWRDQVLSHELESEKQEELEKKRTLKEIATRQFEAAQAQKRKEKEEESQKETDRMIETMDRDGLIWWSDGKPFWKIDGLY